MALIVESVALELVTALRPLMPRIKRADRSLADQLGRAANSIVLNICEAAYSDPGNRRARFHTAAGSANEVRGALRLAKAWGYVNGAQTRAAEGLLDRVLGMLWSLKR
jgi:four helix bundle protein